MNKIHNPDKPGDRLADLSVFRHLCIVEGVDDAAVIAYLVTDVIDKLLIFIANGETKIEASLSILKDLRGFDTLDSITIVRDANGNPIGKIKSTNGTLDTLGFQSPTKPFVKTLGSPAIGILLMPADGSGSLESVLLKAYPSPENRTAAEIFTAEIDRNDPQASEWTAGQLAKRHLRALLGVGSKKLSVELNSIVPIAVNSGLWDKKDQAFIPYIDYFRSLVIT